MFWNDPEGREYRAVYFERFDNVWCYDDFARWTKHDGIILHGRSDARLNPAAVQFVLRRSHGVEEPRHHARGETPQWVVNVTRPARGRHGPRGSWPNSARGRTGHRA